MTAANFDWAAHPERHPALNTPDPSYHGAIWTEAVKPLGPIAYITKARVTLLRDLGSALSPFNAFLTIQGIETLPLRIERHSQNAQAVTNYLLTRPEVTRVIHPLVQTGVFRERADKYLKGGYGGLVGFELAGGKEAGGRFIDALQLFYHVANIGDAEKSSRSIRPQPPIRSSPAPSRTPRASPKAMCACLSALSISTTSLPISIAVLPLLQEAKFFGTPQSRLEPNRIGSGRPPETDAASSFERVSFDL